ncbi:MAG: FtsH protease activity modulator HflK [Gammaproteobacteria bacterium]|nr:MAG: FtsH protease activity modulator HflK [Gammaproteobacteria bacterium]
MAWNEPGDGNDKGKDPWGGGNRGGGNQGPPDLDEVIKKLQDRLGEIFGKKGSGGKNSSGSMGSMLAILSVLIGGFWAVSGFYQVGQAEQAVVLRLGGYHSTEGPGLRWNPPLIDQVTKVDVARVESMPLKATMLTEDENIVDVALVVQYQIGNAKDYLLQMTVPEAGLHHATESALRHVVGSTSMDAVITEGREVMGQEVHDLLQKSLDLYSSGIVLRKVNVEESDPPRQVKDSFDDVIKAKEDKERVKNEAEAYANDVVPTARGAAQRQFEEASAYKVEIVARAEGETVRFTKLLKEYKRAPDVTRERLYIETIESVLSNTSKVMLDIKGGNNMMYLPLDKILQQQNSQSAPVNISAPMRAEEARNTVTRSADRLRQGRDSRRREIR